MYQIGEYIVYGSTGVCEVEKIGSLDIPGMSPDRIYYTLRPCYEKKSTIFTPVDNTKVIMRYVISKEEALELIDGILELGTLTITDEKKREAEYKECFMKCDCRELVKMMNTIHERRQQRLAQGKKVTAKDERYFHMAEENLFGELAIALGIEKNQVKDFIKERVALPA
ncbi:MAG: CarD family transcriptional regulator, partial [Eubacterium sp.]|nr:CarD family transcriptional regulator [Eubacterium sp.]